MRIFYLTHGTINFEERKNFYDTFIEMGHEVVYCNYVKQFAMLGKDRLQDHIVANCLDFKPDIVFCILNTDQIEFETFAKIRGYGFKILNWFCDDVWRFDNYTKSWFDYLDYAVTTDPESVGKYKKAGFENVILSNWAANPKWYYPIDLPKKYDVSFVGTNHGKRKEVIQKLKDANIKISAFGKGFDSGRIDFSDYLFIINQSKINLNIGYCSQGDRPQMKAKNFEIPACKAFMLTQQVQGLDDYFTTDEIAQWIDIEHLIDYIRFWLKQDDLREQYSENAYKRVLKDHTYEKRFNDIFKQIGASK